MVDFSNVKATGGAETATADIELYGLEGMRPVLTCRPATSKNPAYFNASLKAQRMDRGRRAIRVSASMIEDGRKFDRELIPKHCVVGWKGVVDAGGKTVPFSTDAAIALFAALPDKIVDDIRAELTDADTFTELPDPADVEEQAGN